MVRGRQGLLRVGVALALLAIAAVGCGGGAEQPDAGALYADYRAAEDERTAAEGLLRQAFADVAGAAERRDRAGALAAIERGKAAAAEIERLLAVELGAAEGLAAVELVRADGARLRTGLARTREALGLFVQQLEIGSLDPFLDDDAHAAEINRLARRAADLSKTGELAIRRADRAIAVALGVEPRFDPLLDLPAATGP